MSTDIKLSKAQISKIIRYGGFLGSLLSKLAGPLTKVAVPLAKNISAPLGITESPKSHAWCACVLACFPCLRAYMLGVLPCVRAGLL